MSVFHDYIIAGLLGQLLHRFLLSANHVLLRVELCLAVGHVVKVHFIDISLLVRWVAILFIRVRILLVLQQRSLAYIVLTTVTRLPH